MNYRIGSFNVHKLSYASRDEELGDNIPSARAYADIGRIIMENFDIVALQEVMNSTVLSFLFPPYSGWQYSWKKSRSKSDGSDEGYAFAWKKQRIQAVTEPDLWLQYRQDPLLGSQGLLRHPFYGRFTPAGTPSGGPFCEIRLINTHIRFNPSASMLSEEKASAFRLREFRILTEQILSRISDKRYGDNKPAYTFLLGDYNLNLEAPGNKGPYVDRSVPGIATAYRQRIFITVQEKPTTLSVVRKIDPFTGARTNIFDGYANNYDHFTYDECYFNERGISAETDIVDSVRLYRNGNFEKHWREISDHIPIVLELNLNEHLNGMQ